eukprot:gene8776-biopygen118
MYGPFGTRRPAAPYTTGSYRPSWLPYGYCTVSVRPSVHDPLRSRLLLSIARRWLHGRSTNPGGSSAHWYAWLPLVLHGYRPAAPPKCVKNGLKTDILTPVPAGNTRKRLSPRPPRWVHRRPTVGGPKESKMTKKGPKLAKRASNLTLKSRSNW